MSDYENVQTLQFGAEPEGNHQGSSLSRPGGVTEYRVSAGNSHQPLVGSAPMGASVQAGVGGVTTTMGGRSVSTPAVSTFDTGDLTGGSTDFLATARNNGFPARGNLTPDSVVSYQGIETSLATLEAIGAVRRTATGYEAVEGQGGTSQQQNPGQQNAPEGVEYFAQETESAIAKAIDPVPQPIYDSAVAQVLERGLDGINFNELAYQSGMNPTEARQRAEMVLQAFSDQADQIVKSFGLKTPADVWEWAAEEQPEKFANARRQIAFGRNTSALRSLVQEYMDTVPPTVDALRRGGFEVRTDAKGDVVFNYKGRWMTPEAATRAGLV
jgi:hypothetical protein